MVEELADKMSKERKWSPSKRHDNPPRENAQVDEYMLLNALHGQIL